MSGFVGLAMADGAPVDRELLQQMTRSLAFRGPHGESEWAEGSIGLGHTLFRTTDQSEHERQPATLDGQVWIAADARIDGREDLARELGLGPELLVSPDCNLILHAYARWGEQCVEHLIGDFAFTIWDGRDRTLFCARDQFGVKPFYYARARGGLVVSNTLNCVRLHPGVSKALNEVAVADFLLFGFNQDLATTTFADVQRLPPAHSLTWTADGVSVRRYWSVPCDDPIRYRRVRDYVEHFGVVFEQAVRDRVRSSRASIFLSGGLDSTSVAAVVRRLAPSTDLRALTVVYESLIPDDEGQFAALAAGHLGIPLEFLAADTFELFEHPEVYATPEPVADVLRWLTLQEYRKVGRYAPTVLTGQGGDPLFYLAPILGRRAVAAIPVVQTAVVFAAYMLDQRRIPKFHLRGTVRRLAGLDRRRQPAFPAYLDRALVERNDLRRRWESLHEPGPSRHPRRSDAVRVIAAPFWPRYFESADAAWTRTPVDVRHPFFSLPLVRYMMCVPEVPFCVDKYLLRAYASGLLPRAIRRRPKTPLAADPVAERMRRVIRPGSERWGLSHPYLRAFVDMKTLAVLAPEGDGGNDARSRLFSLDLWLNSTFDGECQCPRTPNLPEASTEPQSCGSTATRRN